MINKQRIVETFMRLAGIESLSYREKYFAQNVMAILNQYGIDVKEDDFALTGKGNSGNLICHLPANSNELNSVMFSAHMDTVEPAGGKNIQEKDGVLLSDGTTILGGDDVAGVCAIIEALIQIKENKLKHGDIWAIFSVAEELGLAGAKHIDLNKYGICPDFGFVLDSGGEIGTADIKGPAHNLIKICFKGKSAHAGLNPEDGINAIKMAAEAISNMPDGRIDDETTVNTGVINGGRAFNIVCDTVYVDTEVRSLNKDKLDILTKRVKDASEAAADKFKGEVEIDITGAYPSFNISDDSDIIKFYKKACLKAGIEPLLTSTGGGSDTNIYNSKGIACINLSVGMSNVHTTEEFLKLEDLYRITELLIAMFE